MARGNTRTKRSEKEKRDTLNRFYNDLYADKIRFKLSSQEVNDIRVAVIERVKKIADILGHIDKKLKIRDVILVGSAREGTQISVPGEYDFLLVLDALSHKDLIEIKKMCIEKENSVHIKIKDDQLKSTFKDLLKGDELICTQDGLLFSRKDGLRESFGNGMTKEIRVCLKEESSYPTGVLRVVHTSMKLHGPAFNPQFEWRRQNGEVIDISVDLCPVIRLSGEFPELLTLENVVCETYYNYAREINSIMVLPTKKGYSCQNGLCFTLIFTETELALMDNLSEHHRTCYKLLKYLLNAKQGNSVGNFFDWIESVGEPETPFFSYILKILVLDHHFIQKCTETKCLASCIEKLLHRIISITYNGRMVFPGVPARNWQSNPFFKRHNVWSSRSLRMADRDLMMKLRLLQFELKFIGDKQEYTYDKCNVHTVRSMNIMYMLATPWIMASTIAVYSVYFCPELGHLSEDLCRFLVWKFVELESILFRLMKPVKCKNNTCCLPLEKQKEVANESTSDITLNGLYCAVAIEMSLLIVYIYPDSGHLIGDMCTFLSRKLSQAWKQI